MRKQMLTGALVALGLLLLALTVGPGLAQGPNAALSSEPLPPGVESLSPPDQPAAEGRNGDPGPEAAAPPGNGGESKAMWSSSDAIRPGVESPSPPDQAAAVELDDDPEPVVVTSPGSRASDPAAVLE